MQNVLSFWSTFDARRRIVVVVAVVAMFAAVLGLARLATAPGMALLYAGLEPAAAGEVIQALERTGTPHEVRGESIWVPAAQRDALRLRLAGEGLPATGGAGYELLDQLSGFGTTAQMFDAAYLRAKEGELARTIATAPAVRSARVHLAVPGSQPFRHAQAASASVTVVSAGVLLPAQAQAIRHLVASAVAGMSPDAVAVIDSVTGLVPLPNANPAIADGREEVLRRAVERLLAARVGPGRAMVEVALEVVTEREALTERRFDPKGRVVVSSETEERSSSANGAPPSVTVASNLPEGDARPGEGSRSQDAETRERINYEVSETAREILRVPGGVRRLSVAVLVDGVTAPDGGWQPRSEAELSDLRELVASAIGFDAERGDVITIKSLQFEPLPAQTPASGPGLLAQLDLMSLIQLAITAIVVLALGLFVVRPLLVQSRALPPPQAALAVLPAPPREVPVLSGQIAEDEPANGPGQRPRAVPDDPVARLRALIAEREAESVEILRAWMDDPGDAR